MTSDPRARTGAFLLAAALVLGAAAGAAAADADMQPLPADARVGDWVAWRWTLHDGGPTTSTGTRRWSLVWRDAWTVAVRIDEVEGGVRRSWQHRALLDDPTLRYWGRAALSVAGWTGTPIERAPETLAFGDRRLECTRTTWWNGGGDPALVTWQCPQVPFSHAVRRVFSQDEHVLVEELTDFGRDPAAVPPVERTPEPVPAGIDLAGARPGDLVVLKRERHLETIEVLAAEADGFLLRLTQTLSGTERPMPPERSVRWCAAGAASPAMDLPGIAWADAGVERLAVADQAWDCRRRDGVVRSVHGEARLSEWRSSEAPLGGLVRLAVAGHTIVELVQARRGPAP